jgi:hypothetical protein
MLKHLSLFTWVAYEHPTNKPCLAHEDQTWTTRASRTTIFVGGQDRTTGKATRAAGSACGITHGKACAAIGPSGFADSVAASIPTSPGPKRYQNPFRHGSRAAEYVGVVSYPQPHPPGPLSASGASVGDAGGALVARVEAARRGAPAVGVVPPSNSNAHPTTRRPRMCVARRAHTAVSLLAPAPHL